MSKKSECEKALEKNELIAINPQKKIGWEVAWLECLKCVKNLIKLHIKDPTSIDFWPFRNSIDEQIEIMKKK
jgi:hypothetical protein